jgi:predicted Zn-dependent peptidase
MPSSTNRAFHDFRAVRRFAAFAVALFVCVASRSFAALPKELDFPLLKFVPPESQRVTLPNGMKLYLLEDHELPVFDVVAIIRTGDIYDPVDKIGLSSLTATTVRTGGTTHRSPEELDETLEFIAGSIGSGIDEENARATLSVMSADIDLGLELFADMLMNPTFREDKVELARNQALEGIRRQNDDPKQIASRHLYRLLYSPHPYGNQATTKTIRNITREDLIAFHERYYRPSSVFMAVTGDFVSGEIVHKIEKAFAAWKPDPVEFPKVEVATDSNNVGVFHIEKDLNQTSIWMGHLGLTRTNPDLFPVNVMNYILGGGSFTSRMMSEVRSNRGLAYSVQTLFRRRTLRGPFLAVCGTKSSSTIQAIELMRTLMETIRQEPVTDTELDNAKNAIINSFVFAYTSNAQIAEQEMIIDYYGYPPDFLKTYTDNIAKVTKEDVLRVAQHYLHPERLTIVTVGKESAFDRPPASLGRVTYLSLDEEK